jgi:hypothetical protein
VASTTFWPTWPRQLTRQQSLWASVSSAGTPSARCALRARPLSVAWATSPPSFRRLEVDGDVIFGANVVIKGGVRVTVPSHIPDGEVLRE